MRKCSDAQDDQNKVYLADSRMEELRTSFVQVQIGLTTRLALAEGYIRCGLQTQRLHVARPWYQTPQQSISGTSSQDAATDMGRRRAKRVLDRHDST